MKKFDIVDNIQNIIANNFEYMSDKDKDVLEKISIKKILNLPYYKDFYKNSYLTIQEDSAILSFFNDDLNSLTRDKFYDFNPDFLIATDIILNEDKIMTCNQIVELFNNSGDAKDYFWGLKNLYDKDENFKNNIEDIKVFYENYETDILIEEFLSFNKKIINSEDRSEEYKNRVIEEIERQFLDSLNFQFENRKERVPENINKLQQTFIKEIDFFKKYEKEFSFISDQIKKDKPFLFEVANLDNIKYELIEFNPSKKDRKFRDVEYFVKDESSIFKEKILSKYNISRLLLEKEEESYYSYSDILYSHFKNHDNEINSNVSPSLYGLKYINEHNFERSEGRCVFITASKNDEVIGMVAFSSGENLISGIHNSIVSSVKHNYRGLGLSTLLYDKTAKIFNDLGLTFVNTFYTDEGNKKLKNKKTALNNTYKDCFFLDTDINAFLDIRNGSTYEDFSKRFLYVIKELNDQGLAKGNSAIFKNSYFKSVEKIKNEIENGSFDFFSYEDTLERINNVKSEIIEAISNKNQSKLKVSKPKL